LIFKDMFDHVLFIFFIKIIYFIMFFIVEES
jgi:hypothetical protein